MKIPDYFASYLPQNCHIRLMSDNTFNKYHQTLLLPLNI